MYKRLLWIIARNKNLILYGIIGAICAGIDFSIYSLLCKFDVSSYLFANVLSTHCGIICSFCLNRTLNFQVRDKVAIRFLSFYLIGLLGLAISEGALWISISVLGWNNYLCKLITIIIVALVQFLLNKHITF